MVKICIIGVLRNKCKEIRVKMPSNSKNFPNKQYLNVIFLIYLIIFPIIAFSTSSPSENNYSTQILNADNGMKPRPNIYSPSAKSPVMVDDILIYDVIQSENGTLWEGKYKYTISAITNILGVLNIKANLFIKNSTTTEWGSSVNSEMTIGELTLNNVKIGNPYIIQHQYFFFDFQGENDLSSAKELIRQNISSESSMNVDSEIEEWLDYFNPHLSLEMSNLTHEGHFSYEFYRGILACSNESIIQLSNSNKSEDFFMLNQAESFIQKEQYNFWGATTQNIPLHADDQIINTDKLIYSYSDDVSSNPETILKQYTIISIDPDPQNRKTIVTTTIEDYDEENSIWESKGSGLITVDHSNPFKLASYQTNFLILPSTLRFNINDTVEELEATKYWLEEYNIWDSFDYIINAQDYSFHLKSGSREINVAATYGFDNILMNYELTEYTSSVKTKFISYELKYLESKIKDWLDTPPAAPTLRLLSSSLTTNISIRLSWTQPFFTVGSTVYMHRREGFNSSLASPATSSYIPVLEGLTNTELTFQGAVNYTYYFRVASVNPGGIESSLSNSVTVMISAQEDTNFPTWIIFLIVFIIIGGVATFFMIKKLKTTKKKEELDLSDFS
ncbi:hypothetical protein [Candidatus Lokiarchaeum ossiferum]|uniref:hypothetical protein n=1 Tax=Candidatus Lokiarchaeum ossiferum TaxID=2951803 RepID=UPI00352BF87F